MIDFLGSAQGAGCVIVLLVFLGIAYALICIFESIIEDDFDPVTEAKCKKCICYDVCRQHGCKYDCKDYMTEEDLKKRGLN